MRQLTVLSHYMKRELVAVGVASERVHVIPPFVHGLDPTAPPSGSECILFAGRLVAAKGVEAAVAAWQRSGIQLPLVFAGSGKLRGDLERAGHEVLGWLPHAAMSGALRRARALLMPSLWQEPFGIVGLEAQQLGVPVVAWDTGGVREWHADDELLVPWGDVAGLAAALRLAIERRTAAGTGGFERRGLMDRLEAVYAPSL